VERATACWSKAKRALGVRPRVTEAARIEPTSNPWRSVMPEPRLELGRTLARGIFKYDKKGRRINVY
jgi:hypothetical protein